LRFCRNDLSIKTMDTVVIGCGYVGMRVAKHLARQGHRVYGVRRQIARTTEFDDAGVIPLQIDITVPEQLELIPKTIQWAVNAVSSSKRGADGYRQVYYDGTKSVTEHLSTLPDFRRYVHTSSTSVYGQTDGSWINEDSEREPSTETSQILVEVEDHLLDAFREHGFPASIARVSGIYGPERGYLFQQFLKNEARMVGNGSRIINMVHVDDVVLAISSVLESGKPGIAYNITDNCPTTQLDFFSWLASELQRPLPKSASQAELNQRKRAITNKRVSNQRLLEELRHSLLYPTFREGYAADINRVVGGVSSPSSRQ
jgi:nucleoside-diphosphate-sugar epimerase